MGKHLVSSGEAFIVDDKFDALVSECRWQLLKGKTKGCTSYVRGKENKSGKTYLLHRVLSGALPNDEIDHINGNGLDNRLCNLQFVSRAENQRKRKPRHDSASKLRGVRFWTELNKWEARFTHEGKRRSIGFFSSKLDAIRAYNKRAIELHGRFAFLNEEEH